jgi:ferrous iron transport protein B
MELPIYHKPAIINVAINTRNKLKSFILDAGKIIVLVVLALNFFNSLGTDGTFGHENQPTSVLSTVAKIATPVVAPLGITEENWPATVGLITGLLAKEVVVGSLDALYQKQKTHLDSDETYDFIDAMQTALATIPQNISGIVTNVLDPLGLGSIQNVEDKLLIAEEQGFTLSTLDKMATYFNGDIGAYAYLLLILLYFPCVATFGAIKQELGWRWALYSGGWSMFLGYSVAVGFYQIATFNEHPTGSTIWLGIITFAMLVLYLSLRKVGRKFQLKSNSKNMI